MYIAVVRLFLWDRFWNYSLKSVLLGLIALHLCRYLGIMFSIEGIVAADLPAEFYLPATIGDLITTLLAWCALLMVSKQMTGWRVMVLIFNVVGLLDFVIAFTQGYRFIHHPGYLGTTFFVVTFMVPALFLSHILMLTMLFRRWHEDITQRSAQ